MKKAFFCKGHLRRSLTCGLTHSGERADPTTQGHEAGGQQNKNSQFQEAQGQILPSVSARHHRSPEAINDLPPARPPHQGEQGGHGDFPFAGKVCHSSPLRAAACDVEVSCDMAKP